MSVRQYRWHRCSRRHLSGLSFVECAFPADYSKRGSGQWAVLSFCARKFVDLYASRGAATAELERLDAEGCGTNCTFLHELGYVDLLHARGDVEGQLRPDSRALRAQRLISLSEDSSA